MGAIPQLEPICGSWIIVDRATGKPVMETYRAAVAAAVSQANYEVLTALQWLQRFNRAARKAAE